MTRESLELVQDCWTKVMEDAPAAAKLFYDRLLHLDPQLARHLRGTDAGEQGRRWARGVSAAVQRAAAGEAPAVCADAADEGRDAVVCQALVDVLERVLGDRLTPRCRAAWRELHHAHAAAIGAAALGEPAGSRVVPLERHRHMIPAGG